MSKKRTVVVTLPLAGNIDLEDLDILEQYGFNLLVIPDLHGKSVADMKFFVLPSEDDKFDSFNMLEINEIQKKEIANILGVGEQNADESNI
jgi:hypothetical protein